MRCLASLVIAMLVAPAARAEARGDRPVANHLATGGIITNPIGLFVRHDLDLATGLLPAAFGQGPWGDLFVGVFH